MAERKKAELIEDDEIGTHQVQSNTSGLAFGFLALQRIDQIPLSRKAHPLAVARDASHADGRSQRRLTRPGPPMKTALRAPSVNERSTSCSISARSTLDQAN